MAVLIKLWSALRAQGVCVVNRAVAPALLPKKLEQCLEVLLEQQLHPGLF